MANEENLKGHGFHELAASRQREIVKMGKVASDKSKAEKKTAREIMSYLLNLPIDNGKPKDKFKSIKDIKGKNITVLMAGLANLAKDVAKGDKKAIELALRISGDYVEQLQVNTTDETIEELKSILDGDTEDKELRNNNI